MAIKTLLLLLASSYVVSGFLLTECPPKESTKCECVDPKLGIYSCNYITSQESLEENINALKGHLVKKLSFTYLNASTFPEDLFQGLHLTELDMYDVELSDEAFQEGRSYFLGLEHSLETFKLYLSFKRKQPLTNLRLDHLSSLKRVYLYENGIPAIGNDWFPDGPRSLQYFTASYCGIKELGDVAFASLKNLQTLRLDNNDLKELSRTMLPYPAFQLQSLELQQNSIKTLSSDMFTEMPALTHIHLGYNKIHELPEDTWSPVFFNLKLLDLYDNPLQCGDDLKWVCEQDLRSTTAHCFSPDHKREISLVKFCDS